MTLHCKKKQRKTDFLQDGLVGSPCCPRDCQESSVIPQLKNKEQYKDLRLKHQFVIICLFVYRIIWKHEVANEGFKIPGSTHVLSLYLKTKEGLPWWSSGEASKLPLPDSQVLSLVKELRSRILPCINKNKNKTNNKHNKTKGETSSFQKAFQDQGRDPDPPL